MSKLSMLLDQALTEIEASAEVQSLGSSDTDEDLIATLPYENVVEFELRKEAVKLEVSTEVLKKFVEGTNDFINIYKQSQEKLRKVMSGSPLSEATRQEFLQKDRTNMIGKVAEYLRVSKMKKATAEAIAEELLE